ncbi:fibronectin type III domain-containing protein [Candidatus Electronema sp. JM]
MKADAAAQRSKELEYRVIAVNKAGESEPSNTVAAVL